MNYPYQHLAQIYDQLQQDIDPAVWADYIQRLETLYSLRQGSGDGQDGRPLLLDLGCGTGSLCLEMAQRGYDPIGIDASGTMLDQARQKIAAAETTGSQSCLFLQQDISRFELFGTVDLIVCLLDTVNHLTRATQVKRLFKLCANYLNPGGILIFDLATSRHLARTLGRQLFFQDQQDYTLFWQNHYQPKSGISRSELTIFNRLPDGTYSRQDELITEKYYGPREIQQWLGDAGLELIARHGELNIKKPAAGDERHFYIARRPVASEGKI